MSHLHPSPSPLQRLLSTATGFVFVLGGTLLMLGALLLGLMLATAMLLWALLRGRRPAPINLRWVPMPQRRGVPRRSGEVVDVVDVVDVKMVRETDDPPRR